MTGLSGIRPSGIMGHMPLALLRDILAEDVPLRGQRVVATDGEGSLRAVVAAVDVEDATMLLAVRPDDPANAA